MADDVFLQSYAGTIAPGDLFAIYRRGRSIACIAASTDLEIVINDGSRSKFFAGMALNFDRDFEKVQIYNPTGAPATFEITTAMGRVDDNRLTASGDLNVLDPVTGDSFAEILAMMQNAEDQRKAIGQVGQSFFVGNSISASPIALIDPVSNVNGAILRSFGATSSTSSVLSLYADSSAPANDDDTTKRRLLNLPGTAYPNVPVVNLPLLLPAGVGLFVISNGAGTHRYQGDYDLL